MIKRITKLIVALAAYELIKYLTEQVFTLLTSVDDIDAFNEYDHIYLNNIRAEVSE
ncbi:transcriptional regulator [Staphylococcus pseudintermedius]|uniref:transcriptional activator RinB n=1 Tax=Staphylococcus pseudintermedius TaxID=283734 RepID=UPI0019F834F6|nr:transcriptional activator RinB [Staphylococcus pseudintermedius]EGQ3767990.1 transcriptional regulator [Staphylococcus pseudintermedius]EKF8745135.1 transcriptional regulator [Staphylococcus pseudintermedius]EKS1522377.1 transcriptional regulator [Staphylococcus pseudintermedius]ELV3393502.1 transcriptional regulator [Staphylococcus pseudintermedius]MDA3091417.1 transcriptional activator RinB [Staphylococcus pseudintermedius]